MHETSVLMKNERLIKINVQCSNFVMYCDACWLLGLSNSRSIFIPFTLYFTSMHEKNNNNNKVRRFSLMVSGENSMVIVKVAELV